MAKQQPGKFRLGMDEGANEIAPAPLERQPRGRKRASIGFYIILLILIAGMVAAYFDLYRRVTQSQSIGSNQVENLDNRFSALSVQQATLEKQLTQKISADKQVIKGLEERFNKARETMEAMQKQLAAKTNKSELNTATGSIKKEIEKVDTKTGETLRKINALKINLDKIKTLDADLKTLKSNLAAAKENLSGEIGEITLQLDRSSKNLIELQSKTNKLSTAKIDRKTADSLIKKRLAAQQPVPSPVSNQVSNTLSDHREKIDALKRHMTDLKKNATIYENEILKIKRQLKTLETDILSRTSKITPSPSLSAPASSAKSGDLIQQNLKE